MKTKNFINVPVSTEEKIQLKLTISKDVYDRLENLVEKHHKSSRQEIILELIDFYLPVWHSLNQSFTRAVEFQMRRMAEEKQRDLLQGETINLPEIPIVGVMDEKGNIQYFNKKDDHENGDTEKAA